MPVGKFNSLLIISCAAIKDFMSSFIVNVDILKHPHLLKNSSVCVFGVYPMVPSLLEQPNQAPKTGIFKVHLRLLIILIIPLP